MKSATKRIVFALMIVLLIATLVTALIVLGRVLELFQPADSTQLSDQSPGSSDDSDSSQESVSPGHVHEYVKDKTYSAGCDRSGYTTYVCSCGKTDIRDLTSPTGHSYGDYITVPATCESDGYTERICSSCQYPERTNPVPASHAFGDWLPNDTAPQETRTCASCEITEIRSSDYQETWVLYLPVMESADGYSLQQVSIEPMPNAEVFLYEIYLGSDVAITGYDYADAILSVFYTASGVEGEYTFSGEALVITIGSDGSCTVGAPAVQEPAPEYPTPEGPAPEQPAPEAPDADPEQQ